jgi:hypothetical protein
VAKRSSITSGTTSSSTRQDEWKVRPNFTLTYGLRYETPGNSIASLVPLSERIVAKAGGDQRFALSPVPKRDTNNFQPRFGFNWNPRTSTDGILGMLTGGDKLVVRGGYARTNDYAFININLNIASAFPFVAAISLPATTQPNGTVAIPNAFTALPAAQPAGLDAKPADADDRRRGFPLAVRGSVQLRAVARNVP